MNDSKIEQPAARRVPPNAGKGRPKGSTNKTTALLKDAILQAAEQAGGGDIAAYLAVQARDNPNAFMGLLGKVLPLQVTGDASAPIAVKVTFGGDASGRD